MRGQSLFSLGWHRPEFFDIQNGCPSAPPRAARKERTMRKIAAGPAAVHGGRLEAGPERIPPVK